MAVRLNVIMNHSPPPAGSDQQFGESIIGELIGRPGVDLTLVGQFASLSEGSTDRLRLESIAGDVAVLDWQSPAEIVASLAAIGFSGARTPHPGDPDPPAVNPPTRRIYAFDLRRYGRAETVCTQLGELLAGRQTRTFSLGLVTPPRLPPVDGGTAGEESPPPSLPSPRPESTPTRKHPAAEGKSREETIDPRSTGAVDLDALLNELDDLDP